MSFEDLTSGPDDKNQIGVSEKNLEILFEALRDCAFLYEKGEDHGLEGARRAFIVISNFLIHAGCYDVGIAPFMAVAKGFEDLQHGIMPPLFSLDQSFKEKDRSSERDHYKWWVASILEALVRLGEALPQSAERIARKANAWPHFRGKQLIGRTIIGWRDNYRALATNKRERFEALSKHLVEFPDPLNNIEELLKKGLPGSRSGGKTDSPP